MILRDQYFTVAKSQVQFAPLAARKRRSEDGLAKADRWAWRCIFFALRASVFCGSGIRGGTNMASGGSSIWYRFQEASIFVYFYHDRTFDYSIWPLFRHIQIQWNQIGWKPLATNSQDFIRHFTRSKDISSWQSQFPSNRFLKRLCIGHSFCWSMLKFTYDTCPYNGGIE